MFKENRDKFPEHVDGKPVIDLSSGKFLKVWQGPQHPGVTGNMSLELTLSGSKNSCWLFTSRIRKIIGTTEIYPGIYHCM